MNTMKITFTRIKTFIRSLIWHIWSGFPKANQEQILYRFNICKNCEMYELNQSQCLVCGCNLSTKKVFMNKLAWADQQCPLNKWNQIT